MDETKDIFEKYEKGEPIPEGTEKKTEAEAQAFEREGIRPKGDVGELELEKERKAAQEAKEPQPPAARAGELAEEERKSADAVVEKLVVLANEKGEQIALAEAKDMDQYILDRLHARLIEERTRREVQ